MNTAEHMRMELAYETDGCPSVTNTLGMYPLARRNPHTLLDAQVPCHIG
jgi:hypothetical protein